MSNILAPIEQDPVEILFKHVQKQTDDGKWIDLAVKVQEQLKPKIGFDVASLKERGQLSLLQISEKYGAMFFAFGSELIVVSNDKLNQVLNEGNLDPEIFLNKGLNKTNNEPIAFLAVRNETLFMQHQDDDYLIIADVRQVLSDSVKALKDAIRCKMDMKAVDVRQLSISSSDATKAVLVTRSQNNEHTLLLIDYERGSVLKKMQGITSAIFSADGNSIIVGFDSYDKNIAILDLGLVE